MLTHGVPLTGTLAVCFSYTNASAGFAPTPVSAASFTPRLATSFTPGTDLVPGVPKTLTITGTMFPEAGPGMFARLSTACSGSSDASDVPGGDAMAVQVKSGGVSASVTFTVEPVLLTVDAVRVAAGGSGYVAGHLAFGGGGGAGAAGVFTTGVNGTIARTFLTSRGAGYTSDPSVLAVFAGSVKCGAGTAAAVGCVQTGRVTRVVKGKGRTRNCQVGQLITGVGGGGTGFEAEVMELANQEITLIRINNHGSGYTSAPQLLTDKLECQCGAEWKDGNVVSDSYLGTNLRGRLDACYTVTVGSAGVLAATGAFVRTSAKVCVRFGKLGGWSQAGGASLQVAQSVMSPVFTPSAANSNEAVTVTIRGTGFFIGGAQQTRVKVAGAEGCAAYGSSDDSGVPGGGGKPCDRVYYSSAEGLQVCEASFVMASTQAVTAAVCKRTGAGDFVQVGTGFLTLTAFSLTSVAPATATANQDYIATVTGAFLGDFIVDGVRAKICPQFVCFNGDADANNGEPCGGLGDTESCSSNAQCMASTLCEGSTSNTVGTIQGGEAIAAESIGGCASPGSGCTSLTFRFRPVVVLYTPVSLFLKQEATAPYLRVGATIWVDGVSLLSVTGSYSAVSGAVSSSPFALNFTGRNFGTGDGRVMAKYTNKTFCRFGANSDLSFKFLGGGGRPLEPSGGVWATKFTLMATTLSVNAADERNVVLCWKVGRYHYREVRTYTNGVNPLRLTGSMFTKLKTTYVDSYFPSDYTIPNHPYFNLGSPARAEAMPTYVSGSEMTITVLGQNFGLRSGEMSPLRVRPIPMQYALTPDQAENCILSEDTLLTRQPACKEYRSLIGYADGEVSKVCEAGDASANRIDSVNILSASPVEIRNVSYQPPFAGFPVFEGEMAIFKIRRTLLRRTTRFVLCYRLGDEKNDDFPWQVMGKETERSQLQSNQQTVTWKVFITHTFALAGAYLFAIAPSLPVLSNRQATVTIAGVGFSCVPGQPPDIKVKFVVGTNLQVVVGGEVGGGCRAGSDSNLTGAAIGGAAQYPRCISDPTTSGDERTVAAFDVTMTVEYPTSLEVCWSTTSGTTNFDNAFLGSARTAFAFLSVIPPQVQGFTINAKAPSLSKPIVHTSMFMSISGNGMSGAPGAPTSLRFKVVEKDCLTGQTLPGGGERGVECINGGVAASVRFTIRSVSADARLCYRTTQPTRVWVDYLPGQGVACDPQVCGAATCVTGEGPSGLRAVPNFVSRLAHLLI